MKLILLTAVLTISLASAAAGQTPVRRDAYPSIDSTVVIGGSDTVRLLNRFVLAMAPAPAGTLRYDLQYMSRISVQDSAGRQAQADRVAPYFGAGAREAGAARMVLALCDSRACAETRESPKMWYEYAFVSGHWQRLAR